jgi:hypothetical protein
MKKIQLKHYETGSVINLFEDNRQLESITYTRNIHKYESESDYKTLVTEMNTYGEKGLMETFRYFADARKYKK